MIEGIYEKLARESRDSIRELEELEAIGWSDADRILLDELKKVNLRIAEFCEERDKLP